ncbi:MAG: S41 family peptidase [Pyrinomonadaceae bacterium]
MRNAIPIFILILFKSVGFAQTEPKVILDKTFDRAKQISLYSARVDWETLRRQVYAKAENAKTIRDLKPAFEALLNGLRDHHGRITDARSFADIANFTDWANLNHPDQRPRDPKIHALINDSSNQFAYKRLDGNIGYLKIVGIAPNIDIQKESERIRRAVIELSAAKVDKWIIDLRYNSGGNMNPMMAGIGPLVGEGKVGDLVDLKGTRQFDWVIRNGNFIYGGSQAANLPYEPKFRKLPKIAVLTSRYTVSSGEIVATALKGRPNARSFGEATGSYTTNNSWDIIDGEVVVAISTGVFADRTGTGYPINIPVDEAVPFEINKAPGEDKCIIAARRWLLQKK